MESNAQTIFGSVVRGSTSAAIKTAKKTTWIRNNSLNKQLYVGKYLVIKIVIKDHSKERTLILNSKLNIFSFPLSLDRQRRSGMVQSTGRTAGKRNWFVPPSFLFLGRGRSFLGDLVSDTEVEKDHDEGRDEIRLFDNEDNGLEETLLTG